ncbi:MAG: HlyD family secretion protein [Clostridiales bacterium]|jgi:multidrug resistance efflux pump|nr:HlyD family secretion protein [Clostridiales bacterium]
MSEYLFDANEIINTREYLFSRPPRAAQAFGLILTLALVAAFVWMHFFSMDLYVKGSGAIRPVEASSSIKTLTGGLVAEVNMIDGANVEKGAVLFTLDSRTAIMRIETNRSLLNEAHDQLTLLQSYRTSIDTEKNKVDNSTAAGRQYHILVEKYLNDKKLVLNQDKDSSEKTQYAKQSAQINLDSKKSSLSILETDLVALEAFKRGIETESLDNFPTDSQAAPYKAQLSKHLQELNTLRSQQSLAEEQAAKLDSLYQSGAITQNEVQQANVKVEETKNTIELQIQSAKLSIEQVIEETRQKILSVKYEILSIENEISSYSLTSDSKLALENAKLETLATIDSMILDKETQIKTYETDIASMEAEMDGYVFKAPSSGTLNLTNVLSPGEYLQAGVELGSIVPHTTDAFRIVVAVGNKDIAGVEPGQEMRIKFLALPYQDFGSVIVKIDQVSTDTRYDSSSGSTYYSVEANLANEPLVARDGRIEHPKVGMAVEGQIINGDISILKYLLKKFLGE